MTISIPIRRVPILACAVLLAAAPAMAQEPEAEPPPPPAEPAASGPPSTPVHPGAPQPPAVVVAPHHPHHAFLFGGTGHRSPGLAVVLSLTPIPVDFGNFYAENVGWGVAYTALELSLAIPMMWLAGDHMGHDRWGDGRRWSDDERSAMLGLAVGYVAVKLVAGLHAGRAAERFNRSLAASPVVTPTAGGAVLGWRRDF